MIEFDIIDVMQYTALAVITSIAYIIFVNHQKFRIKNGHYTVPGWNFPIKKFWAERAIHQLKYEDSKNHDKRCYTDESPKILELENSSDSQLIYGSDMKGNSLLIKLTRRRHRVSEVWLILKLATGETYTLPVHPYTRISNSNSRIFDAAGLKLECLVPYSRWRIVFNGELRNGVRHVYSEENFEENLKYVRFNFIWISCSDPIHWPHDWSPQLMATSVATEPWRDGNWKNMLSKADSGGYDQFGSLLGQVFVQDYKDEYINAVPIELNLPGLRQRRWGPHKVAHLHRTASVVGVCCDGSVFTVGAYSSKVGITHAQFGNLRCPNGAVFPIDWMNFHLSKIGENLESLPASEIRFSANNKIYSIQAHYQNENKIKLLGGRPLDWMALNIPLSFGLNGASGFGIAMLWYPYRSSVVPTVPPRVKRLVFNSTKPDPKEFVIQFVDYNAQSIAVSGAKGASIAILASLIDEKLHPKSHGEHDVMSLIDNMLVKPKLDDNISKSDWDISKPLSSKTDFKKEIFQWDIPHKMGVSDFKIPNGFILSTSAFNYQVDCNENLSQISGELEGVCYGKTEGNLQDICDRVQREFLRTTVEQNIIESISNQFKLNSNLSFDLYYTVRPSGIVDDKAELSATGHSTPVLGIKGLDNIISAIQKCWATLFTLSNIQIRKQNIQPIRSSIAVVIQEMIPCHKSGMLITRDPTTGNPNKLTITSRFGTSENVEQSKVEFDVFTVRRHANNMLTRCKKILGSKSIAKISQEDFINQKLNTTDDEHEKFSLKSDEILQLSEIGVSLEQMYGSPCDIKWGIINDEIFIFQTRSITSLHKMTDWELLREFDAATMSIDDLRTTSNMQELLSGAVTPLTQSILSSEFDGAVNKLFGTTNKTPFLSSIVVMRQKLMVDVYSVFLRKVDKTITKNTKLKGISLFGHDIVTNELNRIALHRYGMITLREKISTIVGLLKEFWFNERSVKKMMDDVYKIRGSCFKENLIKFSSVEKFFEYLMEIIGKGNAFSEQHISASRSSSLAQIIAMSIMLEGSEAITDDHFRDFSIMLGSFNKIESAEIPKNINSISRQIIETKKEKEFIELNPENGQNWLIHNCDAACQLFEKIIHENYHRGAREFELNTVTWGMSPATVIKTIQTILKNHKYNDKNNKTRSSRDIEYELSKLITPKKKATLKFLSKILPICNKLVQRQETTKSLYCAFIHELRMGFHYLSELMFKKGLLPSKDLIFFLTVNEIKCVIHFRDAQHINKALRRQKLFNHWNDLKYLELIKGIPQPIDSNLKKEKHFKDVLKGTPVSMGVVTGRAFVVKYLEEINQIESGDILITNNFDIGWSGYFPILGGIVTEKGGIFSQEAILAREYGVPCLVSVVGATECIKTGDKIKLVAENRLLLKIE